MERASHSTASHRSVISIFFFFFLSSSFSYNALPFNLLFKVSLTDMVLHQKLRSCFSFRLNHFYQSAIGKSELKRRRKKNAVNYQTSFRAVCMSAVCAAVVFPALCALPHTARTRAQPSRLPTGLVVSAEPRRSPSMEDHLTA